MKEISKLGMAWTQIERKIDNEVSNLRWGIKYCLLISPFFPWIKIKIVNSFFFNRFIGVSPILAFQFQNIFLLS